LLLEDGFYGIIVDGGGSFAGDYTLQLMRDRPLANWRWGLEPHGLERASLTPGAPVHEWRLSNYASGVYHIRVRPLSRNWEARVFLLDGQNQMVGQGQVQSDGTTRLEVHLDALTPYTVLVTAALPQNAYDIAFTPVLEHLSPKPINVDQVVMGRITPIDRVDEWLWMGNAGQVLNIQAARTEGNYRLAVRIFAPGNLFLQEFAADAEGNIRSGDILLPIDGTYIIQVTRLDEATSPAEGSYEMQITLISTP
jgi:hypothetical protein